MGLRAPGLGAETEEMGLVECSEEERERVTSQHPS